MLPEASPLFREVATELLILLPRLYPAPGAILEIRPGAGGTESEDLARILLRMFVKWCEKKRYPWEEMDLVTNSHGGVERVTLEIRHPKAYAMLRGETGTHRLSRVSPFDKADRRQTSFVSVEVLPVVQLQSISFKESDLTIEAFRAGGPGGQNQNKVSTAVRVKHLPSGLSVVMRGRSQPQNIENAKKVLVSRLQGRKEEEARKKASSRRQEKGAASFGSRIRTYVLSQGHLVKDHRTGYETTRVKDILDGDLDALLESYLLM